MSAVSGVLISCGSGLFCKRWKLVFVAKDGEEKRLFCFCVVGIGCVSGIIVVSGGACVYVVEGRFLSDLWCFPWGYHLLYLDRILFVPVVCRKWKLLIYRTYLVVFLECAGRV